MTSGTNDGASASATVNDEQQKETQPSDEQQTHDDGDK